MDRTHLYDLNGGGGAILYVYLFSIGAIFVLIIGVVKGFHPQSLPTGTDADWIVKLIDVYPQDYPAEPAMGGYQLMIANEVFRGRFRGSFEKPEIVYTWTPL